LAICSASLLVTSLGLFRAQNAIQYELRFIFREGGPKIIKSHGKAQRKQKRERNRHEDEP